jgi:4-hydroxy-tetrahydrodipicolinate synthase
MNQILGAIPEATFGVYECPYPYKRLLSDKVLEAMAASGRFAFIKDTCCDAELIAHRVKVLNGRTGLFNANSATLLETLRAGTYTLLREGNPGDGIRQKPKTQAQK